VTLVLVTKHAAQLVTELTRDIFEQHTTRPGGNTNQAVITR